MILKKPEPPEIRGICVECEEYEQSSLGNGRFRALCNKCHTKRYPKTADYRRRYMAKRRESIEFVELEKDKRSRIGYKKYKKDSCEKCGFKAELSCQLDVDHIDGDRSNNNPNNYQTLCANCHRLKTYKERNFRKTKEQREKFLEEIVNENSY